MPRKNYSDHFEDLYLRHDYLKKAGKLNGQYYNEFKHIINITAKQVYDKFGKIFKKVGFEFEDVESITAIYALSYMELYSIKNDPACRKRFLKHYRAEHGKDAVPSEQEVFENESKLMIHFLRQKLSHCATVCERKKRNIVCGKFKKAVFAFTKDSSDASDLEIIDNYQKHGYRKVTKKELKESIAQARKLGESTYVDENGYKIFQVEVPNHGISRYDYETIVQTQTSLSLQDPESISISLEEKASLNKYKKKVSQMSLKEKQSLLKKFVRKQRGKTGYKDQIKLARKLLKNPDFMVSLGLEDNEY